MATLGRSPGAAPLTSADIPDDSITAAKIVDATIAAGDLAANSVDSSELVDGSVDLSHMSSESVDEDNLHISNAGTNGEFLSKQSGNSGGLTWATAGATGGISDGNHLEANANIADNDFLRVDGTEIEGLTAAETKTALSLNNVDNTADASQTTLGTLTALTGGTGDLNWDSNTFIVDSSASKVGIGGLPLYSELDVRTHGGSTNQGSIGLSPDYTSNSGSRNWTWRNNQNAWGDSCFMRSADNNNTPSVTIVQFAEGGGCNNISGGDWGTISDERIKTEITNLDTAECLSVVKAMTPKKFKWKNADLHLLTNKDDEGFTYGFTAQDLENIDLLKQYVYESEPINPDDNPDCDYVPDGILKGTKIGGDKAFYIGAIQELSAKNDALEAENTALKTRMDALEARVLALEG